MPEQSIREANGLITLALRRLDEHPEVHRGVHAHVVAAQVQLNAAAALLAQEGVE